MERVDRRAFLRRASGVAVALSGWCRVSDAGGAADPRLVALQRLVKGPVIVRTSPSYARLRLVDQERFDDIYPLGIVQPVSAGDVSRILAWSKSTKVPFAIRSGGHSYAGYSTSAGVVVDLTRLSSIVFDRNLGLASIGAGARLIDIEATLARSGVAIPSGSCPTVGIGGLALGGGVGFASRAFGTTSDNIVSLGIVTADGKFRLCSATENPGLFWACRGGGGGNFGVVTHFDFQTHPVGDLSVFIATSPWSQAAEVIRAWQSLAPAGPDEFFAVCYLRTGETGPSIECFGQYLGAQAQLMTLLAPLAAVAGTKVTASTTSYLDAQLAWAGCSGKTIGACHLVGETPTGTLPRANFYAKSDYVNAPLTTAALTTVTQWLAKAQTRGFGFGSLELDAYGGAINRLPPDATAFVHRDALFSAQYLAHWSQPSDAPGAAEWISGFYGAMRPFVSGYAYQNYMDPQLATWKHAYYATNYPRLQEIKQQFDPDRVFRFPQAIPPA